MKLRPDFYRRTQTRKIARELLGKKLCTFIEGRYTAGLITETEAYEGIDDKACHAYNNRRTPRTEVMFAPGGITYVYLCYGIHYMFNIVTHQENEPHAILVRGMIPLEGIDIMEKRRNMLSVHPKFSAGPGTVCKALGITLANNNMNLHEDEIWIEDSHITIKPSQIEITPRIGIDYAAEDAKRLNRFFWNQK